MIRCRALLLLPVFFLFGCDAVVDKFNETYETSYKAAFKKSFMKSCTENDKSEKVAAMCLCMVEDLLANYSASELDEQDKMIKRIQEVLIEQCKERQSK